jgi:hypothetical protein
MHTHAFILLHVKSNRRQCNGSLELFIQLLLGGIIRQIQAIEAGTVEINRKSRE